MQVGAKRGKLTLLRGHLGASWNFAGNLVRLGAILEVFWSLGSVFEAIC